MPGIISNKLIVLILIAMTIAVVVIFILKPDILQWIKNLPDYKYGYDEDVPVGGADAGIISKLKCPENLPFAVGIISIDKGLYKIRTNSQTNLYLKENNIFLEKSGWLGSDISAEKIGSSTDSIINLDENWISGKNFFEYRHAKGILPSRQFLLNLDKAKIVGEKPDNYLVICREKEMKLEEAKSEIIFSFESGPLLPKIRFKYENEWFVDFRNKFENINYIKPEIEANMYKTYSDKSKDFKILSEDGSLLINSLAGRDYADGFGILLKANIEDGNSIFLVKINNNDNRFGNDDLGKIKMFAEDFIPDYNKAVIFYSKGDIIDFAKLPNNIKPVSEGTDYKVFDDYYGNQIIANKTTGKIARLVDNSNKEINSVLGMNMFSRRT